jgi:hypothetical protein
MTHYVLRFVAVVGVTVVAAAVLPACSAKGRCSDKGIAECKQQCDKGDGQACRLAGELLSGEGERRPALGYFDKGCHAGDDKACDELAFAFIAGRGTAVDISRAIEIAEPRCAKGRGDSCALLVVAAEEAGMESSPARVRAIDAYRKECEAKRGGAAGRGSCWELAVRGWLPVDEAVKYAKIACDRGESHSACKDDTELRALVLRMGSR